MKIENGIFENIPLKDYLAIEAFSYSGVSRILRSPAHYLYWKKNPQAQTEAMTIGSLVDCLTLTESDFKNQFAVLPETYINTKKVQMPFTLHSKTCRQVKEDLEASGKTVVSNAQTDKASEIREAILKHGEAKKIIEQSKKQITIIWEDDGVTCKCRLDLLGEAITDLKTTQDASPKNFSYNMNKFNYHIQAALYSDALSAHSQGIVLPYQIIAVETQKPYCAAVYAVGETSILTGREIYKKALAIYKDCIEMNEWPGYSRFIEQIEIPPFAIAKVLEYGDV